MTDTRIVVKREILPFVAWLLAQLPMWKEATEERLRKPHDEAARRRLRVMHVAYEVKCEVDDACLSPEDDEYAVLRAFNGEIDCLGCELERHGVKVPPREVFLFTDNPRCRYCTRNAMPMRASDEALDSLGIAVNEYRRMVRNAS